jgi:hypothetical protein
MMRLPYRVIAAVLLASTSCVTWQVQGPPPQESLSTPQEKARLTLSNGTVRVVNQTRLDGDRVRGTMSRSTVGGAPSDTLSVPLSDIRQVELSRVSMGRTLGLVGGILAAAFIAFAATFEPI